MFIVNGQRVKYYFRQEVDREVENLESSNE